MLDFPELQLSNDGKMLGCNSEAEQVLNEFSAMRIAEPGEFILEKINSSNFIIRTFSRTYGIRYEKLDNYYDIQMVSLDEFGMNVDNFLDINSLQHEIKNPLTIINGTAQLLTVKSKNEYAKKCSSIILNESNRIKLLLENISLISDICLEIDSFSINDFFIEIVDSLKMVFPDIRFSFEVDPSVDVINGDRHKLFMAFNNILKNACEAQKSGVITIAYKLDPFIKYFDRERNRLSSMIKFSITDKAGGIEEELLSKIFTPFFTTKNKGSGLGLVISKELIEKHQGRIELTTEKNVGTTFNILLPL